MPGGLTPVVFEMRRFLGILHAVIVAQRRVNSPGASGGQDLCSDDLAIGQQTQQTDLSDPAKEDLVSLWLFEPS
jgi:hypothetical protein